MFGKGNAPYVAGSGTAYAVATSGTAWAGIMPYSWDVRYSNVLMPVNGASTWNDMDGPALTYYPVPPASSSLQLYQRFWTLYDSWKWTYTSFGASSVIDDTYSIYNRYVNNFIGTMTIDNEIIGDGRCPWTNNYIESFSSSLVPDFYGPAVSPNYYTITYQPDTTATGSHPHVFDQMRWWYGIPCPSWASHIEVLSDTHARMSGSNGSGGIGWQWDFNFSNKTPVGDLYGRAYADFTALNPWYDVWNSGSIAVRYNMAPDVASAPSYNTASFDGTVQYPDVPIGGGVGYPDPIYYPPMLSYGYACSGWDMFIADGEDDATIQMYRAQSRTTDGRPHFYWIGNCKWNNSTMRGWANPPGAWHYRLSVVRSGWVYPNFGENETRIETDFPTDFGYPLQSVGEDLITTNFNFIVIDQSPEEWLAANGLSLGDTYF